MLQHTFVEKVTLAWKFKSTFIFLFDPKFIFSWRLAGFYVAIPVEVHILVPDIEDVVTTPSAVPATDPCVSKVFFCFTFDRFVFLRIRVEFFTFVKFIWCLVFDKPFLKWDSPKHPPVWNVNLYSFVVRKFENLLSKHFQWQKRNEDEHNVNNYTEGVICNLFCSANHWSNPVQLNEAYPWLSFVVDSRRSSRVCLSLIAPPQKRLADLVWESLGKNGTSPWSMPS